MYEVIKRGKRHNLSIECLLDLLDKIVKPILLYGDKPQLSNISFTNFTQGADIFPLQKKLQKFIRYG
jgi:hypothetical protein